MFFNFIFNCFPFSFLFFSLSLRLPPLHHFVSTFLFRINYKTVNKRNVNMAYQANYRKYLYYYYYYYYYQCFFCKKKRCQNSHPVNLLLNINIYIYIFSFKHKLNLLHLRQMFMVNFKVLSNSRPTLG
jgi:hypothetical protein